jgi:ABC-2 type transport system ATP-binding protein
MNHAIELVGVTKRFGRNTAVDSLDLQVPEQTIYGFIGPNGSGKTTTLRMILRIYHPDRGTVVVLGNPGGNSADDRLGYLPEERGLYRRMRVGSLLQYYARLKGHYDCRDYIREWLERLGAGDWWNRRIDTLSKGMAQKVQFIAAIAGRPRLVILDEPFSGLDPVNMESLRDAVLHLRDQGTTILFSTHDMDVAEEMCDTIFMIFKGKKVLDGSLESIQNRYPANRIRVLFAEGDVQLPPNPNILSSEPSGRFRILTVAEQAEPEVILAWLGSLGSLRHFEVIRPSLHEIFVRIARPAPEEMDGAPQANGTP